jgi:protein-tyrosine phosphatase
MFFFGKKKATQSVDLSWIGADMHSHLIPGIDDGAPDIATSIELIRGLQNLGYKKLITTPHVLWEVYPNTTDIIKNGLATLQKTLQAEGIEIEINAAAEYYIDEHFENQLKQNLLSLTGYYGKAVQELADYLLKKEYYSLAGTDLHNTRHLDALQKLNGSGQYARLKESGNLRNASL